MSSKKSAQKKRFRLPSNTHRAVRVEIDATCVLYVHGTATGIHGTATGIVDVYLLRPADLKRFRNDQDYDAFFKIEDEKDFSQFWPMGPGIYFLVIVNWDHTRGVDVTYATDFLPVEL
jgi:hypothetical protein